MVWSYPDNGTRWLAKTNSEKSFTKKRHVNPWVGNLNQRDCIGQRPKRNRLRKLEIYRFWKLWTLESKAKENKEEENAISTYSIDTQLFTIYFILTDFFLWFIPRKSC